MKLGIGTKETVSTNICKTEKTALLPPFLNLIFTYLTKKNNTGNFKHILSSSPYCVKPP